LELLELGLEGSHLLLLLSLELGYLVGRVKVVTLVLVAVALLNRLWLVGLSRRRRVHLLWHHNRLVHNGLLSIVHLLATARLSLVAVITAALGRASRVVTAASSLGPRVLLARLSLVPGVVVVSRGTGRFASCLQSVQFFVVDLLVLFAQLLLLLLVELFVFADLFDGVQVEGAELVLGLGRLFRSGLVFVTSLFGGVVLGALFGRFVFGFFFAFFGVTLGLGLSFELFLLGGNLLVEGLLFGLFGLLGVLLAFLAILQFLAHSFLFCLFRYPYPPSCSSFVPP